MKVRITSTTILARGYRYTEDLALRSNCEGELRQRNVNASQCKQPIDSYVPVPKIQGCVTSSHASLHRASRVRLSHPMLH